MKTFEHITSIKDPRVTSARELSSASGRAKLGKCLLEGSESIEWVLETGVSLEHVFFSANTREEAFLQHLGEKGIPCAAVSEGILKKITDTPYLVPIVGVALLPRYSTSIADMDNFVIVLDRVQDHGNLGTIIRTARAFGIRDLVSTTPDLDLYYKKILSASRGKAFDMRLQRFSSGEATIAALKQRGYQIVATSPYAKDIQSMAPLQAKPLALVVGNETAGISQEIMRQADVVVQIPMSGTVESLNVGVATGISLYELKFRMVLTMLTNFIRSNMGREINVTGKMVMQAFDAELRKVSDLNGIQMVLLMMLACDRTMTLQQAGKDTGTFGQELEDLLHPLLTKHYIEQETDILRITEEGERVLAQLWNVVERAENQVLAGFSEQEKGEFLDYLKRIQRNCEKVMQG